MSTSKTKNENTQIDKNHKVHIIRVGILAEEPLGWGSGKHFFPVILQNYTWTIQDKTYTFKVDFLFDHDILKGRLNTSQFDVLLVPGGGVGDGLAVMKGFLFFRNVRKWKKKIAHFIQNGGGYVGICGGAALMTDLQTEEKKLHSFLERHYNRSALGVSCVSSYYRRIAFPLFYPFQKRHPENIGAIAYVFSFAPGETTDGVRIHTGGAPLDFQICKDHPVFSDFPDETERIRWWGGPALIVAKKPDREVKVLARYPVKDVSEDAPNRIYAWRYTGGFHGICRAFIKALKLVKREQVPLKKVFLYTFFFAGNWELTDKSIVLDYANKPSITAEIFPNENKGRILLCTAHPEYMVWRNGHIKEMKDGSVRCLGTGLYKWEDIAPLSKTAIPELTHTWWMVRRFVAWAAKVPDAHLPPPHAETINETQRLQLEQNIFWDGSLMNQIKNI